MSSIQEAAALARVIRTIVVPVCRAALPTTFRTEKDVYELLLLPAKRLVEFYKADPSLRRKLVVDLQVVEDGIQTGPELLAALKDAAAARAAWASSDEGNFPLFEPRWRRILTMLDEASGGKLLFDPVEFVRMRKAMLKVLRVVGEKPSATAKQLPFSGLSVEAANNLRSLSEAADDLVNGSATDSQIPLSLFVPDPEITGMTEFTKELSLLSFVPLLLPLVPPLITYAQTWFISPDAATLGVNPWAASGSSVSMNEAVSAQIGDTYSARFKGAVASGYVGSDGFYVSKGSTALVRSISKAYAKTKQALFDNGVLVPLAGNPDLAEFVADQRFKSLSAAGAIVSGSDVNGTKFWIPDNPPATPPTPMTPAKDILRASDPAVPVPSVPSVSPEAIPSASSVVPQAAPAPAAVPAPATPSIATPVPAVSNPSTPPAAEVVWSSFIAKMNDAAANQIWRYMSLVMNDLMSNFSQLNDGNAVINTSFATKVSALIWAKEVSRAFRVSNSSLGGNSGLAPGWSAVQFMSNPAKYWAMMETSSRQTSRSSRSWATPDQIKSLGKSLGLFDHFDLNAVAYLREVAVTLQKLETDVMLPATKQLKSMFVL